MRVAILIGKSDRTFGVRHMVDLAKEIEIEGHEVRLVSILKSEPDGYADELGEAHICLGASSYSKGAQHLVQIMGNGSPDLIISSGLEANCVAGKAKKTAGAAYKSIFFTSEIPGYEDDLSFIQKINLSRARKSYYPTADRIIVPAYDVKRRLLAEVPGIRDKMKEIPFPGRGHFVPPMNAPHAWLTEARGQPTFIAAGPLGKNSDFESLIGGIARVQSLMPSKLIILGNGAEKKRLYDLTKKLKMLESVSFASDIENLQDYVYFSDGFISSAVVLGFPDAIVRAMEVPSRIVTTIPPGGTRDVIEAGKYASMVRMKDPDAIACALYEVMKRPKMRPVERDILRFDRNLYFGTLFDEIVEVMTLSAEMNALSGPGTYQALPET